MRGELLERRRQLRFVGLMALLTGASLGLLLLGPADASRRASWHVALLVLLAFLSGVQGLRTD
jgi:hypothetical protein